MEKDAQLAKEHEENRELASKIEFYKDEIRILKNRITELAKDLEKEKDLKELERLQNQLEIQENNANSISHAIRNNEKHIDTLLSKKSEDVPKIRSEQHQKEVDLVTSFERNFKEVRSSIKSLSAKAT
jgi:predicted  nucleic acid-binding Zn-ribbon protein